MSGHSKWHNIQKTKGAADAKRSAAFTKIAKEIIVAVKTGGSGDPNNNSRLATVIAKAKAVNMPNDNIKRTIDKALGAGNTDNYESVVYEGYGPNGVAVIVEALTDNRQRTAPEVRHLLDKFGKGLGATGCVSWSFDRKGVIILDNEDGDLDEDTVMMDALDCGADWSNFPLRNLRTSKNMSPTFYGKNAARKIKRKPPAHGPGVFLSFGYFPGGIIPAPSYGRRSGHRHCPPARQ